MGSSHSDQIESDATNQFFSSSIRKIPNVQCCISVMLSRRPLHYHILNPIGAMQRKAIVCCMTLTQLHSEKEREAIQPNMWIHFTWTAGRRLLLQSQFHSRRMCIQNHIYHLFQSIDNVFQYLYFYQYLLEAFHSEPNSLITKFSSTLSWRKALKYLLKTFIAITFVYQNISSTIPLESPKLFCRCLRPQ